MFYARTVTGKTLVFMMLVSQTVSPCTKLKLKSVTLDDNCLSCVCIATISSGCTFCGWLLDDAPPGFCSLASNSAFLNARCLRILAYASDIVSCDAYSTSRVFFGVSLVVFVPPNEKRDFLGGGGGGASGSLRPNNARVVVSARLARGTVARDRSRGVANARGGAANMARVDK